MDGMMKEIIIYSGAVGATISGIFELTIELLKNKLKNPPNNPKRRWGRFFVAIVIGFIAGVSLTSLVVKLQLLDKFIVDLPGLKFGSPDYYIEVDGQDFGYEVFDLAALQYYPTTKIEPSEARTADQTARNFAAREDYDHALNKHDEAIGQDPNTTLFRYNKGVTLAHMGDYETAAEEFRQCIELNHNIALYHASRGIALTNLKSYEEASAEYQNAVDRHQNIAFYQCNLGFTLGLQNSYEEALKAYKKAAMLDSSVASYHYNLGVVFYQLKEYEDALVEINKAINYQDSARYHRILGFVLNQLERYEDALKELLAAPDITRFSEYRNMVFMTLMYDSAARCSELLDLKIQDLQLDTQYPKVTLTGKGNKTRPVPLMGQTAEHCRQYLRKAHPQPDRNGDDHVFFTFSHGKRQRMSPDNVAYFMKKYGEQVRLRCPSMPERVHPHQLRHTRAIHLYRDGMPMQLLSEFLGHATPETTKIYAYADTEMKRAAIQKGEKLRGVLPVEEPIWKDDDEMLRKLCGLR